MGHVFVKARFRGRNEIGFERILVDTGASFTLNESLALQGGDVRFKCFLFLKLIND
jgi:predicted aspartyl protease